MRKNGYSVRIQRHINMVQRLEKGTFVPSFEQVGLRLEKSQAFRFSGYRPGNHLKV